VASRVLLGLLDGIYNERLYNKKAVLPQGNRAMPQVFFSVEVRQQHSLQA